MKKLVTLLLVLLLTACGGSGSKEPAATEEPNKEEPVEEVVIDVTPLLDIKAKANRETPLFQLEGEELREVGKLCEGAVIDTSSDSRGNYVGLKGGEYYVHATDIENSGRYYRFDNHLLTLGSVSTAENYSLYDVKNHKLFSGEGSTSYDVVVRATEEDPRYGVLFLNQVVYLYQDDTQEFSETAAEGAASSIPVLMYHFFYDDSKDPAPSDGNYLGVSELDEQLNYLKENGHDTLTMRETLYFMQGRAEVPDKAVTITIDDGDPSVYEYAYPVFKKYGMNATLFLICGWLDPEMPFEFWEMREAGMELQSHGFLTHQGGCEGMQHGGRILCMDYEEGVQDTKMSLDYCDGGFAYCYPFGDFNDHAVQILKDAGVKIAFTTQNGWIDPSQDIYALPRVRVSGGQGLNAYIANIER